MGLLNHPSRELQLLLLLTIYLDFFDYGGIIIRPPNFFLPKFQLLYYVVALYVFPVIA